MGVLHDEYDTLTVVLHVTSFEYEQPAVACKAQRAGCIIVAATISHPDCFPNLPDRWQLFKLQLDTARPRTRGLCAGTGGGGVC